ncbi:hypothetical protein [Agarilytica rhodophyticola]|uniref:hypothetical protein n=1 Tax=Agarilytica rhodophyticola TaxID=1737490 RepID=UPI000B347412|nr:hypothetical protein [Agarilytica rhodophyticola]
MKTLFLALLTMTLSVSILAGEKVNSKQSLRLCKTAMQEKLPENMSYKFKRNPATSVEKDRYKHWVNVLEISDSDRVAKKVLCETSRTGEVLAIEVQPGRWKM